MGLIQLRMQEELIKKIDTERIKKFQTRSAIIRYILAKYFEDLGK